jgi:hypothetical protein
MDGNPRPYTFSSAFSDEGPHELKLFICKLAAIAQVAFVQRPPG